MNSSKPWAVLMMSFVAFLVLASLLALSSDLLHPRLSCMDWEKNYWAQRRGVMTFERVSSYFWSSLCYPQAPPLVISSSEGTDVPSFPELLSAQGIQADQFTGAYRGVKTFGYMSASHIHPERVKNLRALVFINPVYFSFAAHTDAANIRLNAISNLAYVLRVHSLVETWDEFLLDSFYVGTKEYLNELFKFSLPPENAAAALKDEPRPLPDDEFDSERNLLKERAVHFTSFTSRFSLHEQPTRWLFENSVEFVKTHPEAKICLVMLPTNSKNLRYFGRDAKAIEDDMRTLIREVPPERGVDLQDLNENPKIFMDPMHLTAFGKAVVLDRVMKTPCAQRVFAAAGGPP